MARNATAAFFDQLVAGFVRPVVFVQLTFVSGPSYVWSGLGTLNWNGHQWLGVGNLGTISAIEESGTVQANGVVFSLSGIPSDLLANALTEVRQGNDVKCWFGFLDAAGQVVANPYMAFGGRMDIVSIDEGAETSTVSITAESRLVDLQRARERRYTHEDQQLDYPGDLGFEYVTKIQDWNGVWGKAGNNVPLKPPPPPAPGGGGGGSGDGGGGGIGGVIR